MTNKAAGRMFHDGAGTTTVAERASHFSEAGTVESHHLLCCIVPHGRASLFLSGGLLAFCSHLEFSHHR